jgi:hypothetical protein
MKTTYTQQQIDELADSALDSACLTIQHHLFDDSTDEVQDSFFKGATKDAIKSILESYIKTEINFMQQKACEEETRYGIEDLHISVNDIFEQFDEGHIGKDEAKTILTNCCKAFIKGDTL